MSKDAGQTRQIQIFDTTLRDGEQSPGITLSPDEKLEIALQLERLGVDVIEAGFPIASEGDFEAVKMISQELTSPTVCALARAEADDVARAAEAIRDAASPRLHTFISTSDIHIREQLKTTREDVLGQARAAVAHAVGLGLEVEFSPMDATRADIDFTAEVCRAAVDEGATIINIPDTVGYATPEEYAELIRYLRMSVLGLDEGSYEREQQISFSVHTHDDLGFAVANAYAGILAGADQIECAVNGIGERAGNCSLEEIVMALRTRRDHHGLDTEINTRELARTSRLVSRLTGYNVPPNKAVVGRNAFAHESGIHQDGVLKARETYEIMDATEVGLDSNQLVLGKHSGRHALQEALAELGYELNGAELNRAFIRFKEIADRKKQVNALDLEAIVSDSAIRQRQAHRLVRYEVEASSTGTPQANVVITKGEGEEYGEGTGDGPVDAIFAAISDALGVEEKISLNRFSVEAVTEGTDALGEAHVVVGVGERSGSGQGVSTDVLEACAGAYLRALSSAML